MSFAFNMEVLAHDIDVNGFARPTSVVRYMLETVDRNLLACHPTYQELLAQGLSFVVSRTALEIIRPIKEYEKLTVETWATESRSAAFPRSFVVKSGSETVAKALTVWALIDINEKRLLKGSEFSTEGYGNGEPLELKVPTRFKLPLELSFSKCGEKKVMYSDIDRNRHMNNTKYFDMLFDYIPEKEKVYLSSCIMNYVGEAPLDSNIEIFISEPVIENGETFYYFKTEINGKANIQAKVGVLNI